MRSKQEIDSILVSLLIGALPILMLSIGHTSFIFYALVIVSASICISRLGGFAATLQDWQRYRWLAAGIFSMLAVILIAMVIDQRLLGSALERALRIGMGVFVVLGACLSLKPSWLRQTSWGIGISALVSGLISWWLAGPNLNRPVTPEYNAVSYGNLALLVSTMTALSLGWSLTKHHKTEFFLKIFMALVGFYGFVLTQTRTGWLAIPFFLLIGALLFKNRWNIKKIIVGFILVLTATVLLFLSNPVLKNRAQLAAKEFIECTKSPLTISSICIRLQLWHASWEMFKKDPWLGNGGGDKFDDELKILVEKKVVSKVVVDEGFAEPHNDMIYMAASYGTLGLIAFLLVYVSPGLIFMRRLIHPGSKEIQIAAAMGVSVCVGFWIFGLTELMFRGMRTMGFYAVTIAWLLALSDHTFIERESKKLI